MSEFDPMIACMLYSALLLHFIIRYLLKDNFFLKNTSRIHTYLFNIQNDRLMLLIHEEHRALMK